MKKRIVHQELIENVTGKTKVEESYIYSEKSAIITHQHQAIKKFNNGVVLIGTRSQNIHGVDDTRKVLNDISIQYKSLIVDGVSRPYIFAVHTVINTSKDDVMSLLANFAAADKEQGIDADSVAYNKKIDLSKDILNAIAIDKKQILEAQKASNLADNKVRD